MDEVIVTHQQDVEHINKVNLTGSVVHKYRPKPDVIILTVAVKGEAIHEADYPNVAFYGDNVELIDKTIMVDGRNYPRVRIEGSVQTTRKQTDDGARFYQNIVGYSIVRTQTRMEMLSGKRGIGSRKADSTNEVCVLGTVANVFPITKNDQPIGAIVTLRTQTDGRTNFPRITCFGGQGAKALTLKKGDTVCATGFLETTKRTREDGSVLRFESIIATEIVDINE